MNEFLSIIEENYSHEEYLAIQYALEYATKAHEGQKRRTGEPYIILMHEAKVPAPRNARREERIFCQRRLIFFAMMTASVSILTFCS